MKTSNNLSLLLITSIIFIACKKDNSYTLTPQQQQNFGAVTAQSDAEATIVFDDVFDNVMGVNSNVALGNTGVFGNAYNSTYNSGVVSESVTNINTVHCFAVTIINLNSSSFFPVKIII